ncbi:MAG: 3-hydroxyacyl-ACP dehydratase FabZ [Elusimicrobia bacterium]|nr:3-hydroxyacyl-ACP dehydratase FabZ [Elusimicrobiota bacterium]
MTETKAPAYKPVRVIPCEDILKIIPHRYPFMMVDRVEVVEEGKYCVGVKCVSANELYFHGHFPEKPIMPGVLMLEGMAQTAAAMMMDLPETKGRLGFFAGINKAKFRRQVVPGDVLKMHVEIVKFKSRIGKVRGSAWVGDEPAAGAELTFAIG